MKEEAAQSDPCHDDETDKPKQCVPDFVNAAYGVPVSSSSECGSPASRHQPAHCLQARANMLQQVSNDFVSENRHFEQRKIFFSYHSRKQNPF